MMKLCEPQGLIYPMIPPLFNTPPPPALLSHFLPSGCSRQTLCYRLSHSKLVSYLSIQASDIAILFVVINQSKVTRNGDGIYKFSELGDCRGMATVVWYYYTHRHAVRWLLKATLQRCYLTTAAWTYSAGGGSHRQEAWPWRSLQIVPHRWGRKACILYFHLLITDTHSPPRQCQLYGKDEYALQGTIHLHSSFCPICVNSWTQCAIVYGLGIKEKKWKRRVKWEEKRTENCLSRSSPLLHVAYLLPVIGSFNVVRGFRGRA